MNLVPLIGNAYANTAHIFLFTYAFKYAKLGGLNQGTVPVMTTFAVIINSVVFYFKFGETFSCSKIIGMMIIISSVIFLSIDTSQNDKISEDGESEAYYATIALILAFIVPFQFSLKHYLIR